MSTHTVTGRRPVHSYDHVQCT